MVQVQKSMNPFKLFAVNRIVCCTSQLKLIIILSMGCSSFCEGEKKSGLSE